MDYKDDNLDELLDYIDPAALTYQEWCGVGMALKDAGYDCSSGTAGHSVTLPGITAASAKRSGGLSPAQSTRSLPEQLYTWHWKTAIVPRVP